MSRSTTHHPAWSKACWLLALPLLAACAAAPAPNIPVVYADEVEALALAGRWWGDYGSIESGRHGRVRFTLESGDEVGASGDVLMVPERIVDSDIALDSGPRPIPSILRVRFVQIQGNTVVGALEPYNDPECGCLVSTTFYGDLVGDVIEGTYISQGGRMHLGHSGRWRVERRAAGDD